MGWARLRHNAVGDYQHIGRNLGLNIHGGHVVQAYRRFGKHTVSICSAEDPINSYSTFPGNVTGYLQDYTASHPIRRQS
jgi:hypothetical protein